MLLEKNRFLIGLTTFILLIKTANALVVLSLNIEDIQRLTKIASPDTAELLMQMLRQDSKILGKEFSRTKEREDGAHNIHEYVSREEQESVNRGKENSLNENGRPTTNETEHERGHEHSSQRYEDAPQRNLEYSPRGFEYSSQRDWDFTTQRAKLRSYKIPKSGQHGQSDLDTIYERPVEKINAQYEPLYNPPVFKQNSATTAIPNIPGEVFEMYASDAKAKRKDSGIHEARDIVYHEEPVVKVFVSSTPSLLRQNFGHKAVEQPDAVHIRQFGNRVISSILSGGKRSAGDLVLRPMEVGSAGGVPPRPGEFIEKRSMLNIQSNVRDIIADPIKYV